MNIFAPVGRVFLNFLRSTGKLTLFTLNTLSHCVRPPFYFRSLFSQMVEIGFYSLPVVALTTMFSGMVIALQSYSGLSGFSSEGVVASVVELTITRELGPVLAALMVAGRVDALTTLSTNPFKYLIVPRVLAGTLMLPVLVLIGDVIGIYGGYLICYYKLDFNAVNFLRNTWDFMKAVDIVSGLTKAAVFGFIVTLLGCYNGYHSKGGAEGVGKATTNAVVSASILILICNYMLTELFFTK